MEVLEVRETPSLTPVAANAGYPYTSIVKLIMTFPDNKVYVGSGAMVDGFHVLTAGHVTYSSADGGWAKSIKVIPEMSGNNQPYGYAWMTYERTYNSFINYDAAHNHSTATNIRDIGLLTLDRNIGNQTGWMSYGYDNNDGRFAAGRIFNTAGYPAAGGYDGQYMYRTSGGIAGLSSDKQAIQYYQSSITTYGGQSGSPVWEYIASTNSRTILGVHVAGSGTASSLNFATRITQAIFNDLQQWRMSDPAPRAQGVRVLGLGGILQLGTLSRILGSQGADGAAMTATYTGSDGAAQVGWVHTTGGTETVTVTGDQPTKPAAGKDEGKPTNRLDLTGWTKGDDAEWQHIKSRTGTVAGDEDRLVLSLADALPTNGAYVG
jgi:V8-like Glu-specific endopeptidase